MAKVRIVCRYISALVLVLVCLVSVSACTVKTTKPKEKFTTAATGKTYMLAQLDRKYHQKFSIVTGKLVNNSYFIYYRATLKDSKGNEFKAYSRQASGETEDTYSTVYFRPKAIQTFYPLVIKGNSTIQKYFIALDMDERSDFYPSSWSLNKYFDNAPVTCQIGVVIPKQSNTDSYIPTIKQLLASLHAQKLSYWLTVYVPEEKNSYDTVYQQSYVSGQSEDVSLSELYKQIPTQIFSDANDTAGQMPAEYQALLEDNQ